MGKRSAWTSETVCRGLFKWACGGGYLQGVLPGGPKGIHGECEPQLLQELWSDLIAILLWNWLAVWSWTKVANPLLSLISLCWRMIIIAYMCWQFRSRGARKECLGLSRLLSTVSMLFCFVLSNKNACLCGVVAGNTGFFNFPLKLAPWGECCTYLIAQV